MVLRAIPSLESRRETTIHGREVRVDRDWPTSLGRKKSLLRFSFLTYSATSQVHVHTSTGYVFGHLEKTSMRELLLTSSEIDLVQDNMSLPTKNTACSTHIVPAEEISSPVLPEEQHHMFFPDVDDHRLPVSR